ncbi:tRNA guanosine-2'-O-methyltransferase, putative [Plasmodium chabaudi adami]|uniref:tRNA guanosine-2'-O-methyltransferase, putative n=1 Tax=Plasmodium chabaudi adami TaxID=5826 RepID=A0A1D3LMK9_PLACE|nr:tRNA guanosine-2'-O-methyltransferase, putative [Plasmodium chabaudi adami]
MSYLIWFSSHNKYDELKILELKSLLETFGYYCNISLNGEELNLKKNKYGGETYIKINKLQGNVSIESIWKNVLSRSILTKGIVEIWGEGSTYDELLVNLKTKNDLFESTLNNKKWCFHFHAYGKIINQEEKVKKMDMFNIYVEQYKNIDILNPHVQLAIFEEYDKEFKGILNKIYFGKCIALRKFNPSLIYNKDSNDHICNSDKKESDNCNNDNINEKKKIENNNRKTWWAHYALNKRRILGPTTTDNELAFIMCNIAKIKKGDIVLDPFVGSGGLLIASSVFNAICIGNDIDIRLLKGYKLSYLNPHMKHKSNKKTIFENFKQYNLNSPEILVSDNSNPVWNFFHKPWIDAIVTDPPYGNRATVRMSIKTEKTQKTNKIENEISGDITNGSIPNNYVDDLQNNSNHVDNSEAMNNIIISNSVTDPSNNDKLGKVKSLINTKTVTYSCALAVKDLLTIASKTLVDNGMLVFLFPVQFETMQEEMEILKHEDFYLISYGMQEFTDYSGRLIVAMQRKPRIY